MSKSASATRKVDMPQPKGIRRLWLKWRFHLNVLLLAIPLLYMQQYFKTMAQFRGDTGLGERIVGEVQVGPWSLTLAETHDEGPESEGAAGYVKEFNAALCERCIPGVKATYIKVGKPRSLRTAGAIFEGSPYRMGAEVPVPATHADDALWITMEGWDGSVHQASLPLADASPKTAEWLKTHGDKP